MNNKALWIPISEKFPLQHTWVETMREMEDGTNICKWRMIEGEGPEWIDKEGRTTITHHSFAAPTHWRYRSV